MDNLTLIWIAYGTLLALSAIQTFRAGYYALVWAKHRTGTAGHRFVDSIVSLATLAAIIFFVLQSSLYV